LKLRRVTSFCATSISRFAKRSLDPNCSVVSDGLCRRKFVITTVKGDNCQAPDLVERNCAAEAPDLLWVADITYIPTWAGFLYLAVVLDAYSVALSAGAWPRHLPNNWCSML
jgi:transposase InsO family protein